MMGYGKWGWWYCRLRGGFGGKESGLVVFDRGQRKGRVKRWVLDWAELSLGLGGLVVVTGFSLDWNWIWFKFNLGPVWF